MRAALSTPTSLLLPTPMKGMTVRRAAEEFNVPRSTLHDRISGRVELGARSGPERYLGDQEEEQLVEFLVNCAKIGYARTRSQVMEIVQQCLMMRGLEITVTHGWWESFCRRHPELKLRTGERLAYIRMVSSTSETLDNYFDLLESTLVENDLSV